MANEADAVDDGFEAMLASLKPMAAQADPIAAAYAAGRAAAGRRGVNRWRAVVGAAVLAAVVPWVVRDRPVVPPIGVPIVQVPRGESDRVTGVPDVDGWRQRSLALVSGLDVLPAVRLPAVRQVRPSDFE